VVLGAYVRENSEPVEYFTARKLLQSPDDFGTGCVVQSEDIPELLEPTRRLWKALGYQGIAEVEYKQDQKTGVYKLIEINARHWDQHQLGRASGVNVSWTAYCHLAGRPIEPVRMATRRVKWIAEDALVLYLLHALRRGQAAKIYRALAGSRMYAIFAWNDPRPLLRYLLNGLLPLMGKWLWRTTRGVVK
jgi:predicted ATP-grasp superfamily ATP-dependent carboligase